MPAVRGSVSGGNARGWEASAFKYSFVPGEGATASAHGDHWSQGIGGGAAATCVRAAGVWRRRRWSVGASRFRAACERVARGNIGLGANIGARPWDWWSQRGTGVHAQSVGGAADAAQRATSCAGASQHSSKLEWPCSTAIFSNFSN
jgi:hypothetical protein